MSHSTSDRHGQIKQLSRDPWNVRNVTGSFSDIMGRHSHIKTIENLPRQPYRLGVVNNNIWIRHGETNSGDFAVFDIDLNKVTVHILDEITGGNTAQQIGHNDVIVLSAKGLHIVDTEGKYQYKITDGVFTDISIINSGQVAVVECQQNKVIFLLKKEDRWQVDHHIRFNDEDKNIKTLMLSPEADFVFVSMFWSHKILKLNANTGAIIQQYGGEPKSRKLGEFNFPNLSGVDGFHCVVVSDTVNGRLQLLHPDESWEEIKLVKRVNKLKDVIILGDFIFILSFDPECCKTDANFKILKFGVAQ